VTSDSAPAPLIIGTPPLAKLLCEAAQLVAAVAMGRSLTSELDRSARESELPRAALIDLTHGTLRRFGRVQAIEQQLSKRGGAEQTVSALLWCSFYALDSGRYAAHTVVDQAVRACGPLGRSHAKGFVNAVLRRLLRDRAAIEAAIVQDEQARWWHPAWWIEAVRRGYPDRWKDALQSGNSHPPMVLRVNLRRSGIQEYLARLQAEGLAARRLSETALLLEHPVPVARLPGYQTGEVSVQDAGAQRAAPYLDLIDGQRVLDACAAPGGKAAHILESAAVSLTALDVDPARSAQMERNFARLGLQADVKVADCARLETWWDGDAFDRILADVPCSSSGVVRRNPDIKWLRRSTDIGGFAARQSEILDALWRVLAPGGKLLYVTCSVFTEENEAVIGAFCARTPQAQRLALPAGATAQLLPDDVHDGFFFALVAKPA
jgi:16S rRNA (cytosine967-C5)-methyltransferase